MWKMSVRHEAVFFYPGYPSESLGEASAYDFSFKAVALTITVDLWGLKSFKFPCFENSHIPFFNSVGVFGSTLYIIIQSLLAT